MSTYETSAAVQEHGRVVVAGVPFAAGTQVEVTIKAIKTGVGPFAEEADAEAAGRAERLLAALDKARDVRPIGDFNRGELYDRDVLR
jgi:hypothetical protein